MAVENSSPKTLRISAVHTDKLLPEPADDEPVVLLGEAIERFTTYADYLNSQITEEDMFYLGDHRTAQKIIEQGLHKNREKFTRKTFETEKVAAAERRRLEKEDQQSKTTGTFTLVQEDVVLQELARRKDANENGQLLTIVYIRTRSSKGHEISGYIDYAHRLKIDKHWAEVFCGKRLLAPRTTDMSYFNWDTLESTVNDTPNFKVIVGKDLSMHFRCQKDFRIVSVNSQTKHHPEALSTVLRSRKYVQVVLYDHWIRLWSPEEDSTQSMTFPSYKETDGPDLADNVTAAILEEDLIEIAKNALGRPRKTIRDRETVIDNENILGQPQEFQNNLTSTMRAIYDIEKTDVRNETLGTFTYAHMMEEFKKLLPPSITQHKKFTKEAIFTTKDEALPETVRASEDSQDDFPPQLAEPYEYGPILRDLDKKTSTKKTIILNQLANPISGIYTESPIMQRSVRAVGESEKMLNPLYRKSQVAANIKTPYQHLENNILHAFASHRTKT